MMNKLSECLSYIIRLNRSYCRKFTSMTTDFSDFLRNSNGRQFFVEYVNERKKSKIQPFGSHFGDSDIFVSTSKLDELFTRKKCASVLILFADLPSSLQDHSQGSVESFEPFVLLIRRAFRLRANPGEIAYPGGIIEPGETPEQSALREAHEEIRLNESQVEIWGSIRPIYSSRGAIVVPNVGVLRDVDHLRELCPQPDEVQSIFMAPVKELVANVHRTNFFYKFPPEGRAVRFTLPVFLARRYRIVAQSVGHGEERAPLDARLRVWGMTAMILHEALCCVLRRSALTVVDDASCQQSQ